jgi:hypothetical protein
VRGIPVLYFKPLDYQEGKSKDIPGYYMASAEISGGWGRTFIVIHPFLPAGKNMMNTAYTSFRKNVLDFDVT